MINILLQDTALNRLGTTSFVKCQFKLDFLIIWILVLSKLDQPLKFRWPLTINR